MSTSSCPYCGAETRPGDNFCLNCGNRLLPATPSPQQAQPVIGESTIPAQEDWAQSAQAQPAPPASSGASWSDATSMTVLSSNTEGPTIRSEVQGGSSPTAQAT